MPGNGCYGKQGRGSESWEQRGSFPKAEFSRVRGWERQECYLFTLQPKLDTGIFWQVFTTKRHKDAPGPDPKVLQALPSESALKEPEQPHRCRTGQDEGSPGCGLNKHWRTPEIAPGFCLLRAGASSWSGLCLSFFA